MCSSDLPILKAGYQAAVDDANAAGGVKVNGTQAKIQLVVLDNASDPKTASSQATTLYLQDNAVALLGPFTPPLTISVSNVAERLKRPLIATATPVEAWLAGRPTGWQYSWDVFFDENQQTNLVFQTANLTTTNKRVALFTDTEQDGYTIVYHAVFPVGATNFSSQIAAAKAANAQVLISQMISTDPNKLNTAIGQTDKTYTSGPLKFGTNHADAIPAIMLQWQNNATVQVYPSVSGVTLEAPAKGLA